MPVRIPSGAKASTFAKANSLTTTEVGEAEWIVIGADAVPGQKAGQGVFAISADIGGVPVTVGGVKHGDLESRVVTLEDEVILEKAGSKKQPLVNPATLTFFRIFLDILFTFEVVLYAANVKYQPRRIDNSINVTDDLGISAMNYRNMQYILDDSPFLANQIKDSQGAMETFATLRTTHTLANLANLDSLTKGFDIEAFYKEDLRLSEVLWLSQALSDEGKAILERKERPNLLAQK